MNAATLATHTSVGEDHGQSTNRQCCSRCGSPIVSRLDAMPDLAFITAGTLADTSWLQPTLELGTRSAQPWCPRCRGQAPRARAGLSPTAAHRDAWLADMRRHGVPGRRCFTRRAADESATSDDHAFS